MDVTPPQAPTSRAFDKLMGRQSPPMRTGHVDVLAERAVGDDVDGPLPGIVCEVDGDLMRVVYATGDDDGTVVESWLHADQVRQLAGVPPRGDGARSGDCFSKAATTRSSAPYRPGS